MRTLLICAGCLALIGTGCGEDVPPAPEMSGLELACVDSQQAGVDSQVLESVSVVVTDPDRDLVGVDGTINAVQITLSDDDADQRFVWSPPEGTDPMACSGDFVVSLTALDKAGHETNLYEIVQK